VSGLIGAFICGVIVGLIFGPDSERENVAKVDGWISGYKFARRDRKQP
jgi:hypothetical protein